MNDINVRDKSDWCDETQLMKACYNGTYKVVFDLIKKGANVNALNMKYGYDAMFCLHGFKINKPKTRRKIRKLLLANGASINRPVYECSSNIVANFTSTTTYDKYCFLKKRYINFKPQTKRISFSIIVAKYES